MEHHNSHNTTKPPNSTYHITTHDSDTGLSTVHTSRGTELTFFDDNRMAFDVVYTTSTFPSILNDDADVAKHAALMSKGKLGLVNPHGTVCRVVDFAPGYECVMHRTQSVDYIILVSGELELVLDSGDRRLMKGGDIAVQRGTMHSWKNPSHNQWARIVAVLQYCEPVVVGGKRLKEDLGAAIEGIPLSEESKHFST